MNELIEILEKIYNDLDLRETVVPLFISNPGQGKSEVIEQFAKNKGVNLVEIIGSQILPYEISGMAMPTHKNKTMTYYDFDKLNSLKDGDVNSEITRVFNYANRNSYGKFWETEKAHKQYIF